MKDRIRQIRKENELTQKEFAERLGVKQNTVASYEMGRIGISDSVVISTPFLFFASTSEEAY